MRLARLAALCALGLSANAFATSLDSLDLYFSSGELETGAGSSETDVDGFGAKFRGSVGDDFFFSGEYQQLSSDADAVGDYQEWRAGLGTPLTRISAATLYGLLEYLHAELDDSEFEDDGGALHLGVLFSPARRVSLYGQIGYLKLDDSDGPEYLLGAAYQVKRWGGLFAEYRDTDLELDADDGDAGVAGWRAGIYLIVPR